MHMDSAATLPLWVRRLSFVAAGLCLFAGALGVISGQWTSIGMVALGLAFGLRALVPGGGKRWLQVLVLVLFAVAGTLAVVGIFQRALR